MVDNVFYDIMSSNLLVDYQLRLGIPAPPQFPDVTPRQFYGKRLDSNVNGARTLSTASTGQLQVVANEGLSYTCTRVD